MDVSVGSGGTRGARRSRRGLAMTVGAVIGVHAALLLTAWSAAAAMGPGSRSGGLLVRLLPAADEQSGARGDLRQPDPQPTPAASPAQTSSETQLVRETAPRRPTAGSPSTPPDRPESTRPIWHAGQVLVRLPQSDLPGGARTFTLLLMLDEEGRVVQVTGSRPALPPELLDATTALLGETRFDPEEGVRQGGELIARLNIRFEPAEWLTY